MPTSGQNAPGQSQLFAVGFGFHLAGMVSQSIIQSLTREFEYRANARGPTLLPSIEEIIHLWYTGGFDVYGNPRRAFTKFALAHGIDFRSSRVSTAGGEERRLLWNQILESRKPHYPIAFLRRLLRRTSVDYDTDAQQTASTLLTDKLDAALKLEGITEISDRQLFAGENEDVSMADVLLWVRLGIIDANLADDYFKGFGLSSSDRGRILLGRYTPISPADMVQWAATHSLDGDFATRWGTDDNKPDWWNAWANRNGLNYLADPTHDFGSPPVTGQNQGEDVGPQTTVADCLWRSHWKQFSLGDMAQILHRIRGNPDDSTTWNYPPQTVLRDTGGNPVPWLGTGVKPLSLDEANTFMDANGVPETARAYIYNMMYETVSMRHIRPFIATGTTNVQEVAGWLMDGGQRPDMALRTANVLFMEEQQKQLAPIIKQRERALDKLRQSIEQAYATGTISQVTALAELTANGMDQAAATTTLSAIDVKVATELTQKVISRARSDVMAGILTVQAVGPRLISAGIAPPRVAQLTQTWLAELSGGRLTLSTDKILRFLRKGYLTRDAALVRLTNLGWKGADILLLLSDVQAEMQADTAKTIAASEQERSKEERAIERQIGKMGTMYDSLASRLKALTPPAKVLKWYKAGLWSEDRARKRLRLMLYTDDVIDTMLLEALGTPKQTAKTGGGTS